MQSCRSNVILSMLTLALAVALGACGKSAGSPAAPTTPGTAGGDAAGTAGPSGTLAALQNGDASCNVELTGADGKTIDAPGDFELCQGSPRDASALLGKRVTTTTRKQNVMAASCQGNPDCKQSDTVDLIATITAAK